MPLDNTAFVNSRPGYSGLAFSWPAIDKSFTNLPAGGNTVESPSCISESRRVSFSVGKVGATKEGAHSLPGTHTRPTAFSVICSNI